MGADIRAAVDHAEHLIGALLILARNERGLTVREEVDLATVAEDVLDDRPTLGDRRVHATLEPAVISGDPVLAERLVANLVDNAVRYNVAGGDVWVSTRTVGGQQRADGGQHRPGRRPRPMPAASSSRSSGSATGRRMTGSGSAWPSSRPSPRSTAAPPPPAPGTAAACPSRSSSPRSPTRFAEA